MSYEESLSYFKHLENLDKIGRTKGPAPTLPVDNKNHVTSSVGKAMKTPNRWCHYCDKNNHNTADYQAIAKAKQQKKAHFEAKAVPGKKSLDFFSNKLMLSKGN